MNKKMPKGRVVITSDEIIEWALNQIIINTKADMELQDDTPIPSIEAHTSINYIGNLVLPLDNGRDGTLREQLDKLKLEENVDIGKRKLVTIKIRFMY